jgi:hypothetical protein
MVVLRQRCLARTGWILVFGGALVLGGSALSTDGPAEVRALCVADGVGSEDAGDQCAGPCVDGTTLDADSGDCVTPASAPPTTAGVPESDGSSAGPPN